MGQEQSDHGVLAGTSYRLDYYWASWCKQCPAFRDALDVWARTRTDVQIIKWNVDEEKGMAQANLHHVMSVPTVIVSRAGSGIMGQAQTIDQLKKLCQC